MTLQIPAELAGILDWLGMQWPQFDEDKGYEAAQAWSDAIAQLVQNAEQGNAAAQSVNFAVQSTTSQAFNDYWDKWTGSADAYYGGAATHAQQVAALLIDASDNAQWAKVNIIAQLVVLAIVIARDIALAFITDGLSLTDMFIEAGITRELIARILDSIVMGVLMTTLPDAVTDGIELVQGRMVLNSAAWERLGGDVVQGAAFGVVGGLANEALGAAFAAPLRDLAGKALSTLPGDLAESPVLNRLADQGVKTVLGVAGGAAGNSLFNAAVYGFNAVSGDGRNGGESFGQAVLGGLEQGARYGVAFSLLPTRSEPDTVTGNLADGTAFSGKVDGNGVATVTTTDGQKITFDTSVATAPTPESPAATASLDSAADPPTAATDSAAATDPAAPEVVATAPRPNTADAAAVPDTEAVSQAGPARESATTTTVPGALHGATYQVTDPNARRTVAVSVDADGNADVIGSTVFDHSGGAVTYDPNGVRTGVYTDVSKVTPDQVSAESSSLYQSLTGKDTRITLTAEGHITQVDVGGRSDYYAVSDGGLVRTGSSVVGPDNTVTHYDAEGTPLRTVDSHGNITAVAETQPVRELISEPLDRVPDSLATHAPLELSAQARTEDAQVPVAQSAAAIARGEGRTIAAAGSRGSASESRARASEEPGRGVSAERFSLLLNGGGSGGRGSEPPVPSEPREPDRTPTPADERSSAPFGFRQLRRIDREGWLKASTDFEQGVGAFDFRDPAVLEVTRSTLRDLRAALRVLNDPLPGESRADFERRIDQAFLGDQPAHAGNVGTRVSVDALLEQGDPRETVTALYNALYTNRDRPEVFKNAVVRVADAGEWERLRAAGVNVEALRNRYRHLDSLERRAFRVVETSGLGRKVLGEDDRRLFARDPVATGNVLRESAHPWENLRSAPGSQQGREDRSPQEQEARALTAQTYADLGAPLGGLSREFVQEHMALPVDDPAAKLPWREGATVHATENDWTRRVNEAGLPAVDGISLTTTKMLAAAELLGVEPARREQFVKALMAWMLPGRDHSLYETALGAQIADAGPLAGGRLGDPVDPVGFYRRVLDWHGESGARPDLPLPHQTLYQHLAADPEGFTEARHNRSDEVELNDLVSGVWRQLSDGRITDGVPQDGRIPVHTLQAWSERHGIDPADPEAVRAAIPGLTEAHVTALAVYTTHSHTFINHALTVESVARALPFGLSDAVVRAEFEHSAFGSVKDYLSGIARGENPGRLPIALRPVVHSGPEPLNKESPLTPEARQWVEGGRGQRAQAWSVIRGQVGERLPALFDEIRVHTDMLTEALHQLPTMGRPEQPVLAYRGDRVDLLGRSRYSGSSTARQVLSASLDPETAISFIDLNPGGGAPTLVVYELTGRHARDISPFTVYRGTQEVVFPPGAQTRRVTDPARVAAVTARLPDGLPPGSEIIVMEEV